MTSIPDWARNSVSLGPPPVFSSSSPQSLSPLSTGFAEGGAEFVSPEFGPSPHRLAFGGFSPGGEILEMTGLGHVAKCELSAGEGVRETEFTSSGLELPAKKAQRLGHGASRTYKLLIFNPFLVFIILDDKGYTEGDEVVGGALGEREEVDVVLEKKEEQTLGFTVCRGNDAIDGGGKLPNQRVVYILFCSRNLCESCRSDGSCWERGSPESRGPAPGG